MANGGTITIKLLAEARQAPQAIGKVVGALTSLGGAYAAVRVAAASFNFAKEAAKFEDASRVLKAAGVNINDLRDAVGGMVSDETLVKQANLARLFGINARAFGKFSQVAIASSKATGLSMEHMLSSIITGTARQSRLILDNLGITLSLSKAYENYGKQIGKSARELSEAEKQQAVMNEVMKQGDKIIAGVAKSGANTSDVFEQTAAQSANLALELKSMLVPVFQELNPMINEAVTWLRELMGTNLKSTTDEIVDALTYAKAELAKYEEKARSLQSASSATVDVGASSMFQKIGHAAGEAAAAVQSHADKVAFNERRIQSWRKEIEKLQKRLAEIRKNGGIAPGEEGGGSDQPGKGKPADAQKKLLAAKQSALEIMTILGDPSTASRGFFYKSVEQFREMVELARTVGEVMKVVQKFQSTGERMKVPTFPVVPISSSQIPGTPAGMRRETIEDQLFAKPITEAEKRARALDDKLAREDAQRRAAAGAAVGMAPSDGIGGVLAGFASGGGAGGLLAILQQIPEPFQVMLDGLQKAGAALFELAGPKFGSLFKSMGDNMWLMLTPLGGLGPLLAPVGQLVMESEAMARAMSKQDDLYAKLQAAMEPFSEALLEGTGLMPTVFEGLRLFGIALVKLALQLSDWNIIEMTDKQVLDTVHALAELENAAYNEGRRATKARKKMSSEEMERRKAAARAKAAQDEVTESLKELNQELQNVPSGLKIIMRAVQNSYAGGVTGDIIAGAGGTNNLFATNGIGTEAANKWNNSVGS